MDVVNTVYDAVLHEDLNILITTLNTNTVALQTSIATWVTVLVGLLVGYFAAKGVADPWQSK